MKKIFAMILTVIMISVIMNISTFASVDNIDSDKFTSPDYDDVLIVVYGEGENNSEVFVNCKPEIKDGKVKLLLGRLMASLEYKAIEKNETDITISNGIRNIQLFYNKKEAKVDGKSVTLKNVFTVEEKNVYYNYIDIEDIEALFSYKASYDNSGNNVVLFVTENTPKTAPIPETPDIQAADTTMEQKLAELNAYKIFQGDDKGNLNLDKEITRAEFCKVICTALGYDAIKPNTPGGSTVVYNEKENVYVVESESMFNDVSTTHWAYSYIKLAYDLGLINGVGNNRFCPSDSITEVDALKIIACALGYAPQAETSGGYPDGFLEIANKLGIGTDTPKNAILRKKVVDYIYTALDIPLMAESGFDFETQTSSYEILDGTKGTEKQTLRMNLNNKQFD